MTREDTPPAEYRFEDGLMIAGRYQVLKPLGVGGFAQVYHCKDTVLHRDVTVKVLNQKEVGLDEARAAAGLEHSHIVQIYDVATLDDGTPIIIFRYVAGRTLAECLAQAVDGRLPLNTDTLRIIQQISEALDYAHKHGVIHRDVKPSNIIIDSRGNACLTDFGLAKIKWPGLAEATRSMLTGETRQLSGTIAYMAPEQLAEGKEGDELSDLYSWGVVVYKILTGQLPYPLQEAREQVTVLVARIIAKDPIPPTQANSKLPKGVEDTLLKVLSKNPASRYPSCTDFAAVLTREAQTYAGAQDRYQQAQRLLEAKDWRGARDAFESLQHDVPGFERTDDYLTQVRNEIRKLKLRDDAQKAIDNREYQNALGALKQLNELDPSCDVTDLRQQACDGLYRQALEYFRNKDYQACLDALHVIHEQGLECPDNEGIKDQALRKIEQQRELQELYELGVKQDEYEQWEEAVETFQKLKSKSPRYKDVDTRLTSAHHLALLTTFLNEAQACLNEGRFADCVDKLTELQNADKTKTFKGDQVARLRQEALNRLHQEIESLLQEEKFENSLNAIEQLKQRASDQSGLDELSNQAIQGIYLRDLRIKLDELYQRAVDSLRHHDHEMAWGLWQAIQSQKESLDFPDPKEVETRTKSGLCQELYEQAVEEFAQGNNYPRALDLLSRVHELDASYPDRRQLEERARLALKEKEDQDTAERKKQDLARLMYAQALDVWASDPQQALDLWRQVHEMLPNFPDDQQVEGYAKNMLQEIAEKRARAQALYDQALKALKRGKSQQALTSWDQIRAFAPEFLDSQQVEERARTLQKNQAEQARKVQAAIRRWGLIAGGIIALLILIVFATAIAPSLVKVLSRPKPTVTPAILSGVTPLPVTATLMPSATPTAGPVQATTPTLFPTPIPLAIARQPAGIYPGPDANCQELATVKIGEQVTVTGRSGVGNWFYIRNDKDVVGFVYAPRFEWVGTLEALPTQSAFCTPVATPFPTPGSGGPLTMDFWPLTWTGTCKPDGWHMFMFIAGHGADGPYTYYWEGQKVGGPMSTDFTFEISYPGREHTGTGAVVAGDGQRAEKTLLISPPPCVQ